MIISKKAVTSVFVLIMAVLIEGCGLFPQEQTPDNRPAPVRPVRPTRPAPTRPLPNPAPTKRTPGVSSISSRDILSRISRIRTAVEAKDWKKANRETNAMATDIARYKPPTGKKVGGITDMAKFDADYARLQADVKAKNAARALDDLKRMEKMVKTTTR